MDFDWRAGRTNIQVDATPESEYQYLGSYVTGVPDSEYPWHADDVRTIRRLFDPGFIPIFRKTVFKSRDGAILIYPCHGVGRYTPNREPDPRLESCLMPYGVQWPKPNVIDLWFERATKDSFAARNGLPAPFVPWGEWVIHLAEESAVMSAKQMKQALKDGWENRPELKAQKAAKEDAVYRQREEAPRQIEALQSMTSSDLKELQARAQGWRPPIEPKPFVHLSNNG